jgi:hypothetical protein
LYAGSAIVAGLAFPRIESRIVPGLVSAVSVPTAAAIYPAIASGIAELSTLFAVSRLVFSGQYLSKCPFDASHGISNHRRLFSAVKTVGYDLQGIANVVVHELDGAQLLLNVTPTQMFIKQNQKASGNACQNIIRER